MTTIDSYQGTVRCSCGKFYDVEIQESDDGLRWHFHDVTRPSDPQQAIGPHDCPDNRFRWHRDTTPDPRYLLRVHPSRVIP